MADVPKPGQPNGVFSLRDAVARGLETCVLGPASSSLSGLGRHSPHVPLCLALLCTNPDGRECLLVRLLVRILKLHGDEKLKF